MSFFAGNNYCDKCGKPLGIFEQGLCLECEKAEQEPCDAVSRDAVIGKVKELFSMGECYCDEHSIIGMINGLPPVTQKSGKWIRVTDKTGHLVWECDKCSWQQRFNTNFCPDCGAKMG